MSKLAIKGGKAVRDGKTWPMWPPYNEREKELLLDVLESHNWGGYPSPNRFAKQFAKKYAEFAGAGYGVCAANGTVTLEVALKALNIKAGDEVIVPTYTWIATAAAPIYVNSVPVFADVTAENYTLDPAHVEVLITEKTRAIIPVHLGSSIADMDALMAIAKKHNLFVIEDCAHMHGARWRDKGVGAIGDMGSFSFQSSKLMTSGEGGLLLTNDPMLYQRTESLVNCGRKEPGYDEFEGDLLGYNYRIGEFQAAVLIAQLEKLSEFTTQRAQVAAYLNEQLEQIDGISIIKPDKRITQSAHYQYIFKYNPEGFKGLHRDQFLMAVMAEGICLDGDFYEPIPGRDIFNAKSEQWPMLRPRYGEGIVEMNDKTPVATHAAYHEAVWMHYPYLMQGIDGANDVVAAIRKVQENVDELL